MFVFLLLYTCSRTSKSRNCSTGSSASSTLSPPFRALVEPFLVTPNFARSRFASRLNAGDAVAIFSNRDPYSPSVALTSAFPALVACADVSSDGKNTSVGPCADVVS